MKVEDHEKIRKAAEYIRSRVTDIPKVAVICGSGLGGFVEALNEGAIEIPYAVIPYFSRSTVQGHAGKIIVGTIGKQKKPIICVSGRLHYYEGHSIDSTVFSIWTFAVLGVKLLVVTNAAGGLNPAYEVGSLMIISDHLNIPGMAGLSPLVGPQPMFGERFTATNDCYIHKHRRALWQAAQRLRLKRKIHEGVYAYLCGPTFESAAECRMLLNLGADAVGMSTVPEVVVARQCNMEVVGLSLITNAAITTKPRAASEPPAPDCEAKKPSHSEVIEEGARAAADVEALITEFLVAL